MVSMALFNSLNQSVIADAPCFLLPATESVMTCNTPTNTFAAIPCGSCANSGNQNSSNRCSPPLARAWNTVIRTCGRTPCGLLPRSISTRNTSSRTPQSSSRPSSNPKRIAPASVMRSPLSCPSATRRLWSTWRRHSIASRIPMSCCNWWSWNLSGRMRSKTRRIRWGRFLRRRQGCDLLTRTRPNTCV